MGAHPPSRFKEAIDAAAERIRAFHDHQRESLTSQLAQNPSRGWHWDQAQTDGGTIGQRLIPLARVGVYAPGGNALYPSSVLMNAIPAISAGVQEVVLATPPRSDGTLAPEVLYAAKIAGIRQVMKAGGAAALAGLVYLSDVDKIVGPGNRYVNEAKRQLWGQVGLDGYAGPSEVCVVVDDTANAAFAAADFMTQIEHAPDNQGFLIALTEKSLNAVYSAIESQIAQAPRRETMLESVEKGSLAILVRNQEEAIEMINLIAPEHITVAAQLDTHQIQNAGCILVGEWSPESGGDYAFGPSHTLPTARAARFGSPVNVLDFIKVQSVVALATREEFLAVAPIIEAFGEMEGLPGHAAGSTIRSGEPCPGETPERR
jgi:histidinol dehydrogenase